MTAVVTKVVSVSPFGENLSQVDLENGMFIIANRKDDGSFRWAKDEIAIYVSENSIIPDNVLKERGYWNDEKNKGMLGGNKGNKVKGRNFGPEDDRRRSVGLLFKCDIPAEIGDDVSEHFGITE